MSLLGELQRRNVLRVAVAYLVFGWLTLQIVSVVAPILDLPAWVARATLLLLGIGFLAALVVAWIYELTPEGLRRTADTAGSQSMASATGNRLDRFVLVGLALVAALFVADRFWPGPRSESSSGRNSAGAAALRTPGSGAGLAAPADASIAVLPLANLSGDASQEYFSDGMSEELLNALAKVPDLRVAARTSSFQFKGRNLDIQDIARKLNVATVLEGSVRKSGDRIRITAQLIDAASGFHLWSETYDRDLDDIFAVQDEIAGRIVGELLGRLGLAPAAGARSGVARAASPEAYDAYLLGRELLLKRTATSVADGLAALQRATTLDPAYAPAWAQLASAYFLSRRASTGYGDMSIDEAEPLARAALATAKRLDPELDDAYAVEGVIAQFFDNDLAGALAAHERALARNPGNAQALQWRADLLGRFGRYKESLEQRLELAAIDPLLAINNNSIARDLAMFGRNAEAETYARRLDHIDPAWAAVARAGMHGYAGEWGDAMSALLGGMDEQRRSWSGRQYAVRLLGMLELVDEAQRMDADGDMVEALRGDWAGATAAFDDRDPNPVGREFWYFRRGQHLFRAGRLADALEQFDRTWPSVWPFGVADDTWYYTPRRLYYALALRESGREEEALRVVAQNRDDVAAARRDGIVGPIVDLMAAELAIWDGDLDGALRLLPRGLMAEPFLSSIESDPLYAPVRDRPAFTVAVAGERERRLRMREEFLRAACALPADAPWRPLPASCATVAAESGDEA